MALNLQQISNNIKAMQKALPTAEEFAFAANRFSRIQNGKGYMYHPVTHQILYRGFVRPDDILQFSGAFPEKIIKILDAFGMDYKKFSEYCRESTVPAWQFFGEEYDEAKNVLLDLMKIRASKL